MEQAAAREVVLRDELVAGRELPPVSPPLRDAEAVVALLREEGGCGVEPPEWLTRILVADDGEEEQGHAEQGGHGPPPPRLPCNC